MKTQNRILLKAVIDVLRGTQRMGPERDEPEGVRYIEISNTLASRIADDLDEILKDED